MTPLQQARDVVEQAEQALERAQQKLSIETEREEKRLVAEGKMIRVSCEECGGSGGFITEPGIKEDCFDCEGLGYEVREVWKPAGDGCAECDDCEGSGICPECKGEKTVLYGVDFEDLETRDCDSCGGSGRCYLCLSRPSGDGPRALGQPGVQGPEQCEPASYAVDEDEIIYEHTSLIDELALVLRRAYPRCTVAWIQAFGWSKERGSKIENTAEQHDAMDVAAITGWELLHDLGVLAVFREPGGES